jgi:hypothetical protein
LDAICRLGQRRDDAHWYRQIANVTIEWFSDRWAAESAERAAIKTERPLHNIVHAIAA